MKNFNQHIGSHMIPQVNLKAIYEQHQDEINAAVQDVLSSGHYLQGKYVKKFETEFSSWLGIEHTVSVANGTDAIELALRACGVGPGDFVATVSHTAVATVSAIERCGAIPIFIDIDEETMCLCTRQLEAVLDERACRIKAVIPVHLYGHMVDMKAVMTLSKQHEFFVIEDCAQAHGAKLQGQKAGTFGHVAAFSFYPTKNLGAFGDAGAVVTNDDQLADRLRCLKQYGWVERNQSTIPGVNSRMDEFQAAILGVLLGHLDQALCRRQKVAIQYQTVLHPNILLPTVQKGFEHAYHLYVIRTSKREDLLCYLEKQGIQVNIHYPIPVHQQLAYEKRALCPLPLTVTEVVVRSILSLPMNPYLAEGEAAMIVKTLLDWKP